MYSKEEIIDKLKIFESNEFVFDPVPHKYTYKGNEFISATTFIQRFSETFDSEYWANYKADQQGVPVEWVKAQWKELNDYANELGTDLHDWIEYYFTKRWRALPTNPDTIHRIKKFLDIYALKLHELEPVAFEVRIFSEKWRIAGMIDALFLIRGNLFILDWKTNKKFETDETMKYPSKLLFPFQDYLANHHNEYSLQLNLYALILKQYGIKASGAYLVHIGPDDDPAKIYKVKNLQSTLEEYLNKERVF